MIKLLEGEHMKYELKFTLRIDEATHKELCIMAEKEQRSLNGEILFILQKYLTEERKKEQSKAKKRKTNPKKEL